MDLPELIVLYLQDKGYKVTISSANNATYIHVYHPHTFTPTLIRTFICRADYIVACGPGREYVYYPTDPKFHPNLLLRHLEFK